MSLHSSKSGNSETNLLQWRWRRSRRLGQTWVKDTITNEFRSGSFSKNEVSVHPFFLGSWIWHTWPQILFHSFLWQSVWLIFSWLQVSSHSCITSACSWDRYKYSQFHLQSHLERMGSSMLILQKPRKQKIQGIIPTSCSWWFRVIGMRCFPDICSFKHWLVSIHCLKWSEAKLVAFSYIRNGIWVSL